MSVNTDRHDGLAIISLAVPGRGNALSPALVAAADEALQSALADRSVHTVTFVGEGRHLCTGFDLADLNSLDDGALLWRFVAIEQFLQRIWLAPVRTAAIAQGSTFGAGADLFAACDERWLRAGARFRFPGAGFGLVLGTRRLADRVGTDRARRWVAFAQTVGAGEALASGFANGWAQAGEAESDGEAPAGGRERPVEGASAAPERLAAQDDWSSRLARPPSVDRDTQGALNRASRADLADADLAALVRSAARPGLRARIEAYRNALAGARAR
ncbi:MAG: enoyl-CoA hydratase/isomerase family protein [Burkholderiaceae bacterium]